jgi:hypothetical protein
LETDGMAPRRKTVLTYLNLKAKIVSCDISYQASQTGAYVFSDLLSVNMIATIESIDAKLSRHQGKELRISLTASGRQTPDPERKDEPMLFPINLRGDNRDLSGTLPSDALLALPSLIDSGRISFIWVWFEPPRQGYGLVRSIAFLSEAEIANY